MDPTDKGLEAGNPTPEEMNEASNKALAKAQEESARVYPPVEQEVMSQNPIHQEDQLLEPHIKFKTELGENFQQAFMPDSLDPIRKA